MLLPWQQQSWLSLECLQNFVSQEVSHSSLIIIGGLGQAASPPPSIIGIAAASTSSSYSSPSPAQQLRPLCSRCQLIYLAVKQLPGSAAVGVLQHQIDVILLAARP